MEDLVRKFVRNGASAIALAMLLLALAVPAGAQKKDKKKQMDDAPSSANMPSMPPQPESQAIDRVVGEAMGYWQIGDVESLHKYYADDVVVVSGAWEPPVIGWDNYVRAYQEQRSRVTGGRMDRSNTVIQVNGNSAWATYQFDYVVSADGKVAEFRGHTTLILNKRADRWVIVLNHSSIVEGSPAGPPASSGSAQPARP
jgi:ketosteroid isomerase-like protein